MRFEAPSTATKISASRTSPVTGSTMGDLLARVVDEHLVAGRMVLAHHRREAPFELAEQIAEPAVAVPVRVGVPVLLPQHHQIDAGPLQLARKRSPIRLDPPAQARPHAGAAQTGAARERRSVISAGKGQLRPAASARLRLSWTVDRATPSVRPISRALTPSRARRNICRSWRMVSSLLAGIPFSSLSVEDGDAVVADPRGTAAPKSATGWPASSRNGGRHQIGTVADIVSEQVAGLRRNT